MVTRSVGRIPGAGSADLLIACGDLTNYGRKPEAKRVLDELLSVNRNLLAVIGNLDHPEINDYLEDLGLNLHRQARLLDRKLCLVGAGGSNPTPFGTPAEYPESELTAILRDGWRQGREFLDLAGVRAQTAPPVILVSHAPPYGTRLDRLRSGKHVGSRAVRDFIEEHQPAICLCGHIHEARGEDRLGHTHILNPGMLQSGGWVEITYLQSILQATLH